MALVSYSDSEDEPIEDAAPAVEEPVPPRKRKRDDNDVNDRQSKASKLPPLPQNFHSLYSTSTRTYPSDNPELHGGRTRQVPHVEGHWPTHVYLEWYPERRELSLMREVIDIANIDGQLHSLLQTELGAQLPLHISLSAPLVLKSEQKDEFEHALVETIKLSSARVVEIRTRGLKWEPNFDSTRWFLVFQLNKPFENELNELLACCNKCASMFDLPLLYDSGEQTTGGLQSKSKDFTDAFHISIAWQLAAPTFRQRTILAHPNVIKIRSKKLMCPILKLKMGNTVKDIHLSTQSLMGIGAAVIV